MRQIASNLYLETSYPGVNVLALSTRKGLLCIDTPTFPHDARAWVTRIRKLHPYTVSFLILSDAHSDRILNSRWFNAPIITQHHTEQQLQQYEKRFPSSFYESLVARNPTYGRELLNGPVEQPALSFGRRLTLGNGHERLELLHMPGPTAGTVWVYFPQAGVVFTGDSVVHGEHPCLAVADCPAWLASLELLLHDERFQGVETIIPGRGDVCDRETVLRVMEYIQETRQCVRRHLQTGRSREELNIYVSELAGYFPTNRWPRSWTHKQIRAGLEHLYDRIQLEAAVRVT